VIVSREERPAAWRASEAAAKECVGVKEERKVATSEGRKEEVEAEGRRL
jgi:hypothetical protein